MGCHTRGVPESRRCSHMRVARAHNPVRDCGNLLLRSISCCPPVHTWISMINSVVHCTENVVFHLQSDDICVSFLSTLSAGTKSAHCLPTVACHTTHSI